MLVLLPNEFNLDKILYLTMVVDSEIISPSSKKGSNSGRFFPKWAIYTASGIGVLVAIGLIQALLPVIGMAFLLAFIWSQSTTTRRY